MLLNIKKVLEVIHSRIFLKFSLLIFLKLLSFSYIKFVDMSMVSRTGILVYKDSISMLTIDILTNLIYENDNSFRNMSKLNFNNDNTNVCNAFRASSHNNTI